VNDAISVVRALAVTADRRARARILSDAFLSGQRDFFVGMRLAYDKLVLFGVKQVAEIAADDLNPDDPGAFSFADFIDLTDRLRMGALHGVAARVAIDAAARACHGPTWNEFYRPVLLKAPPEGWDRVMINRVLVRLGRTLPEAKQWLIPVFGCQLMQHAALVVPIGRRLIDVKLAGVRTLAVLDKLYGTVNLFDRQGNLITACPAVRDGLRHVLTALAGSVVLDGVLCSPQGLAHLKAVLKNPDHDSGMVRLALFDILPLRDFRLGSCPQPQWQRHHSLSMLATTGLLRQAGDTTYVITKQEIDFGTSEGQAAFAAFRLDASAVGLDCIVIKDPEASYRFKRTAAWYPYQCPP
jgi:hypothetical protein